MSLGLKLDLAFNNVKPKDWYFVLDCTGMCKTNKSKFLAGWIMDQGHHSWSPCDFCVSSSPFGLNFGTLDFGLWMLDLGLTNFERDRHSVLLVNSFSRILLNYEG